MMSDAYLQKIRKVLKEHLRGVHEDQTIDVDIKISVSGKRAALGKPTTYYFDVAAFDKEGVEVMKLCRHELSLSPGDSIHVSGFRLHVDIDRL